MKTVIIDNSLCAFAISDKASPEHIYKYIEALAQTGVRYVEVDFRTIMKMTELPEGIGYIFRVVDPMFAELADVFDFSYILLTLNDLKRTIKTDTPAMLELPGMPRLSHKLLSIAQQQVSSKISAVRLRGSYPMASYEETKSMVNAFKNSVTVPVDICPINDSRTALDSAIKLSMASVDSITMTMGLSSKYCSLEEYLYTMLSVYYGIPREFSMSALCRAAVFHKLVFRENAGDSLTSIMRLLDYDIHNLMNADTGERVAMRVSLKDNKYFHRTFESVLEKMAEEENIPADLFEEFREAINHYDKGLFNEELMYKDIKGPLN